MSPVDPVEPARLTPTEPSIALSDAPYSEELDTLRLLVEETRSSVLAFARYRSVADREAAVGALKARLKTPVVELALSPRQKNPLTLLRAIPPEQGRVCAFVYDAEQAFPEFTGYVNLQREAFADFPHAVVFWVTDYGLKEIATRAPDFWAWRSGVFDFRTEDAMRPATIMQMALPDAIEFRDRGDLERRVSLYRGLIEEYGREAKPDTRYLGRLRWRLAVALYWLARLDEADIACRQALDLSRRAGDRSVETDAVHLSGVLAAERGQWDKAEDAYRESLRIREEIGDESNAASAYHQLGMIAEERQQFDAAEQWYRKALEIRERSGLERYAASDYHQLGNVALRRSQFDAAERWYRKALDISERLGLERDAAAEYHQLGTIAQERQQFDAAEKWYRKALDISERLGLPPLLVNTLAQFGILRRIQGRLPESVSWLGKALAIAAEYEMRVAEQIRTNLALAMGGMGEEAFAQAWKQAFEGQEPPLELFREAAKRSKES